MKTVAVISARMASSRLPGKTLKNLLGKPMIEQMLLRLARCRQLNEIVVAIPENPSDDGLKRFIDGLGFACYRGSENDVLGRLHGAAQEYKADTAVRLTGDCPLIDPEIVDALVADHHRAPDRDLTSNVIRRTYPRGQDTEVLSFACLDRLNRETTEAIYREHVTNYLYDHPDRFKLHSYEQADGRDDSQYRICVDCEEDFSLVEAVYRSEYPKNQAFGIKEILSFLEQHPEWASVNAHIKQVQVLKKGAARA